MLFFPTNDLNEIIMKHRNKRLVDVSKWYAWFGNTPVDIKLQVLDQCMHAASLCG